MREKAEQGHYPSFAPLGFRNNQETKRIEIDPKVLPSSKNSSNSMPQGTIPSYRSGTRRGNGWKPKGWHSNMRSD